MLEFQFICLLVTLYVLYKYIEADISTSAHRLLPLFLGIVAFFNLCQVARCIFGKSEIITCLQDVLMLQVLHVILHYVTNFCYTKLPKGVNIVLTFIIMVRTALVFFQRENPKWYMLGVNRFALLYMLIILVIGIYAFIRQALTRREHRVVYWMYLALLPPVIVLQLRNLTFIRGDVILPASLVGTCMIIYYLLQTGQLTDTTAFLQENLYNESEIAMVMFDAGRYYLSANQAALKMFPEELPQYPRKHGEQLYRKKIWNLLQQPGQALEVEENGRYFQCQLRTVMQRRRCRGYMLSIVDITGQKQELRRMEQLKKEAETQAELKGKFLAGVSHDLRSPLHAIQGLSDGLLVKKELSAKTRSSVRQIKNSSRGLLKLVNDILEYSKLEAGKIELANQPYSLEHVLKEVAQTCLINLQEKQVDFQIRFMNEYPDILIGDELRIREIFQNLLSNAVKYTEEGSIQCEIYCQKIEADRVRLECRVHDTGIGMTEEQVKRVFGEYESFAESQGGIGLGLSIVRQLAEQMDGYAQASSDGSSGSTFSVVLQQRVGECAWNLAHRMTKAMLLAGESNYLRPIQPTYIWPAARVLLADDLKVNRSIFRDLVEPWKVQLDTVKSGEAVLEAIKGKKYDLIFLDQMMPGMTGLETAKALQAAGNTVPLVLITADISDKTRAACVERGMKEFLAKPVSANRLKQILEQYLPQEGRQPVLTDGALERREQGSYRKMLVAVRKELTELQGTVERYAEEDLEMFRIKMHGMKGFCKQISHVALARNAEAMEMAAKTENRSFIKEWLPDLLAEMKETMEEITAELAWLPEEPKEAAHRIEGARKEELFGALKQAFDAFDMLRARKQLAALEALEDEALTKEDQRLLEELQEACEDFDYELGSQLCSERMTE